MRSRVDDCRRCSFEVHRVVEGVEDAEDVYARLRRSSDERVDDVVGVWTVSDEGLPPEQHLEGGIWNEALECAQAFPRVLSKKSSGGIERRAAPNFHGVEAHCVHALRDREHVVGPQAGRHEALMSVTEGSIGDLEWAGCLHTHGHPCPRGAQMDRMGWAVNAMGPASKGSLDDGSLLGSSASSQTSRDSMVYTPHVQRRGRFPNRGIVGRRPRWQTSACRNAPS